MSEPLKGYARELDRDQELTGGAREAKDAGTEEDGALTIGV